MAFETKTLPELVRASENALSIQFYGKSALLRKSVLKVLAAVFGGLLYMIELTVKKIWKNRFVSTCDVSALDGFGTEYGIPHKAPLYAKGTVTIFSIGELDVPLPQGTAFRDDVAGKEYETTLNVTVPAGKSINAPVVALEFGSDSDLSEGAELSFRDSLPDGLSDVVSVVKITGGLSIRVEANGFSELWGETAEEYRRRLLNRIQNRPLGGSANDYWQWAMRFPIVSDAFVLPGKQSNSVVVAVANYNSEEIAISDVTEIKSYITSDVRRPITADVDVISVTPVAVSVYATITPFTDVSKSSVRTALSTFLRGKGPNEIIRIDDMESAVKSGATVKTFAIDNVLKVGASVQELTLDWDVNASIAQVANLDIVLSGGAA